jgi:hypothetical protein
MTNIYDFIFKENILTPGECQFALDELEDINFEIHSWHTMDKDGKIKVWKGTSPSELSSACPAKNYNLNGILQKSIDKAISLYTERFPYCGVQNTTHPKINKYIKNTKMKAHVDHIHGIFDGKKKGIPIISIVGALNDNYFGGEFIFNNDYEIKFKAGDVLIFPSVFLYRHKVKPVTDGTRFSYVSWGY